VLLKEEHRVAQRLGRVHIAIMHTAVTGVVHGSTVALDEPVPPLEGQRVRVTLEPLPSDELELSAKEQSRILREWATRGPQGPLDADDAWPDEN
jgi:hypothetical protein